MRVWLLSSEFSQDAAGGRARYVDHFARLLGAAGHEVVVIAQTAHACDTLIAPGVRWIGVTSSYHKLNEPNPLGRPDTHPAYPYNILSYWPALSYQMADEILRLLTRLPLPDIIESQESEALAYYLLQRKLTERTPLEKIPLLVHLHSPQFEIARWNHNPRYRLPEYWVGQMEKFCIVGADAVLSPSAFLARWVETVLGRPLEIAQIPYPVTVLPAPLLRGAHAQHLVYVGRLEVRKGVLPLVKVCSRLWEAGVEFQLTMVGGDSDFLPKGTTVGGFLRERYAKWIHTGHLTFTGQLDHAAVLGHIAAGRAVLIPSLWDNFPHTCLEAMGLGQVVLASRAGGQAEMIETDGVNGFLFDWDTPGECERQLLRVLALSAEERQTIGHQAQARIRMFCDPSAILARRMQHYEAVIARHAPRRSFPRVNHTTANLAYAASESTPRTGQFPEAKSDLLSVIIPYYNLGDFVLETFASILATTYTPYEVIIVNDGSTNPKSLAVLQEIESRHLAHVRVLHTENQGLAAARNTGAEAAQGNFIAFVDADDMVEPDFFSLALDVLQRYSNVSLVYSWVRYCDLDSNIWPTWNAEFPYLLGHNMLIPLVVLRRSAFLQWARNTPTMEYSLEDYEGWVGLMEAGGLGVSLARPLVRYRVREGSMYRGANRNQMLYLYDVMTQRHPEAYRQWGVELFNLQNANGPGYAWSHPAQQVTDPSPGYVAALAQDRDRLVAEVRTLGKGWEDHARFIADQRTYIESLEARCRELMATQTTRLLSLPAANGVSWQEYEIGGRLIHRLRHNWVVQRITRSPALKKGLKKLLRLSRGSLSSLS